MKFVFFCHAISSCWNNGNAHFLRGVTRNLAKLGHKVTVYEQEDGWSRLNAIRDGGARAIAEAATLLEGVRVCTYLSSSIHLDDALDDADVVIVHEWTDAWLVEQLQERRLRGASFRLLFHDTHHRAITAPGEISPEHLDGFDAALVFGEALRETYLRRGLIDHVFTWHEAADTTHFHPRDDADQSSDLIWIGNWGDEERSAELREFLIEPAAHLRLRTHVYGVRYPEHARSQLEEGGLTYRGWLPNHRAPAAFGRARVTLHVPRGPYVRMLPGIPTIRVFEALACGIPLICSPWMDCEELFPSDSFLVAADGARMTKMLRDVLNDDGLAEHLKRTGLRAIQQAHTCAHRASELLTIVESLRPARPAASQPHQEEPAAA